MSRKSHKLFLAATQSLGHSSHLLEYTSYQLTIDTEDCNALQELKAEGTEVYWEVKSIKGNVVTLKVFNQYVPALKDILRYFLTKLGATGYELQQLPPDQRVPNKARRRNVSSFNTNLPKEPRDKSKKKRAW